MNRVHERIRLFKLKKTASVLFLALCLTIALSPSFELPVKAQPTSVTVGPSQSGVIQAAINNATLGETIFVSPGVYNESLEINQTVSLIGQGSGTTFINGTNNQFIVEIEAYNVTIQGFTIEQTTGLNPANGIGSLFFGSCTISNDIIENSQQGINLTNSNYNTISSNTIINNQQEGIVLSYTQNDTISDNNITTDGQYGIYLAGSSFYNLFTRNVISVNFGGIYIDTSSSNVFSGNTFVDNSAVGETIATLSIDNTFYDNNFFDSWQVSSTPNFWDFSGQGNFWSNYVGQNRGDGISNGSYGVASGVNLDDYPLMGEFSSFPATYVGQPYQVSIISNSTISDFAFEAGTETGKIIQFNVTNAEGAAGFSRIGIPTGLINTTSVLVLVGYEIVTPNWLNIPGAFNYLYLTYSATSQTIIIISSETLDLYNQLLTQYQHLNATYYELLSNYTTQFGLLNNATAQLQLFNNYTALLNGTYANLSGNYSLLQQAYEKLNASYQQHLYNENQNVQNVHSLMYIFAGGTAILIIATVYFSKRTSSQPKETSEKREPILTQLANSAFNLA